MDRNNHYLLAKKDYRPLSDRKNNKHFSEETENSSNDLNLNYKIDIENTKSPSLKSNIILENKKRPKSANITKNKESKKLDFIQENISKLNKSNTDF
jgi:hypothetical protein